MAETAEIKLKVTSEVKNAASTAQKAYSDLKSSGGLDSKTGQRLGPTIAAAAKQIDELTQKEELTKQETKQLKQAFDTLYKSMNSVVKTLVKMTPELEKALKVMDDAQKNLETKQKALNTLNKRGKMTDSGFKIGRSERDDTITRMEIYKGNKNGEPSGVQIKREETLDFSKNRYFKKDGTEITKADVDAAFKKRESELTISYKGLTAQVDKAAEAFKKAADEVGKIQATHGDEKTQTLVDNQNKQAEAAAAVGGMFTTADKQAGEEQINQINTSTDAVKKQTGAIGKAIKQFAVYRIVLGFVKKALHEAVKTVRELDKSLTEQAMVTGKTRQQTYGLLKDYQNLAGQLGSTSKEVAEVATQFMRQGKTTQEAMKLTEAAISAAKVAGISATDSVQYLTTALNGFRLAATDAMQVSDRFAAIAANSATSYEEIAIALSKVASQANLAGMSIDYTTALLSKGLETTREAPETIGTALKTVIARMRELTDYGETLDDSMDVNNVETQLAYVGIALKNQQGELRSTEDVLDDLGRKWDALSANQQAAVAKALAGTRQQSRLIAMMSDYDRVLELEEISLRSTGATAAQMSVYLEGMEASLNKVSNAWEKVTTSITDNEVIIGLIDNIGEFLDFIGGMLETTWGMVGAMTVLGTLALSMLGHKMQEWSYSKLTLALTREQNKIENQTNLTQIKIEKAKKQQTIDEKKVTAEKIKQQIAENNIFITDLKRKQLKEGLTAGEQIALQMAEDQVRLDQASLAQVELELDQATKMYNMYNAQEESLKIQNSLLQEQGGFISSIAGGITGLITPITTVISLMKLATSLRQKHTQAVKKDTIAEGENATVSEADSAAKIPYVGWIIAGIIMTAGIAAALAGGIAAANSKISESEKAAEKIDKLSNSIYKTTQTVTALKQGLSTFDELNSKLIKTTDISNQMGEALEKAADKLTDDQRDIYSNFSTTAEKAQYLNQVLKEQEAELTKLRKEQLELINKNPSLLYGTDPNSLKVQSAVKALANNAMYEQFDKFSFTNGTDAEARSIEKLTQAIIGAMDAEEALQLVNNPQKIKAIFSQLDGTSIASTMLGDDESIADKVKAYREAMENLTGNARNAFKELYSDIAYFADSGWDTTFAYLDKFGLKAEEINKMNDAFLDVGLSAEAAADATKTMFEYLASGATVGQALENLGLTSEKLKDVLNAFDKIAGTTMLDMGQQTDKLLNSVSNIYEKAGKWNEMTQTERTQFLSDNAELFKNDAELWDAFQSGNYERIRQALANSKNLKDAYDKQVDAIKQQIEIEEERIRLAKANSEDIDDTYLKYLNDQLETTFKVFDEFTQASLKVRLDQQNAALEAYKNYLKDQNEAEEEALNKRKEAYQNYFDAINQEQEDEDYEANANQLISNISKIGASSDAASMKQQAELEKQLADLEAEREKELRQRAQEAVIKSIDDQVERMNNTLDELLDNERALLEAMTGEITKDAGGLLARMAGNEYANGATDLQYQDFMGNLASTFSYLVGNMNWDGIGESGKSIANTTNNFNTSLQLTQQQQNSLAQILMEAAKQGGYNA